ncbi:MAG: nuclear transport factor 2 family protein [Marmoricola sp.]|nr:nuclear transport factor 2 family protein [Marmoricola sp.]
MSDPIDAVRRYYTTVDTLGVDEVVALFTANAVYRRPGYEPMHGTNDLRAFYGGQRVIAEGRHTLVQVLLDGANTAVQGEFRGVLRDGTSVKIRFADFLRFEGDLIAERCTYFDAPAV